MIGGAWKCRSDQIAIGTAGIGPAIRIHLAIKTLFPRIVPVVHPLPSRSKMSPQGAAATSRFSFGPG